ncbi:MAG: glycosyltransferase family 2 protein [Candidatus Omnitrophota bacterium]|jgi:GT2 family glycosyltransferase|nr:MAG: glycosyltransferase family 2 protein [Candidatus Omnitrophota bacterium]
MSSLSIIIVNYNSADHILRCIASINRLSIPDKEIIVVDNDSTPDDIAKLKGINYPEVKIIFNHVNNGFAAASNIGYRHSKGELILFLNPDTMLYARDSIVIMADYLLRYPGVAAVGPKLWLDDEQKVAMSSNFLPSPLSRLHEQLGLIGYGSTFYKILQKKLLRLFTAENPVQVNMLSGAAFMTSRDRINKIGLFDENFRLYFEDTDWFKRAQDLGFSLVYLPQSEIVHYHNQSAKLNYKISIESALASQNYYLRKHYSFLLRGILKSALTISRLLPAKNIIEGSDYIICRLPPVFTIDNKTRTNIGCQKTIKIFEYSSNPYFYPCAISVIENNSFAFNADLWGKMKKGRYFGRFIGYNGSRYSLLSGIIPFENKH